MARVRLRSLLNISLMLSNLIVPGLFLFAESAYSQDETDDLEIKNSDEIQAAQEEPESEIDESLETGAEKSGANDSNEKAPPIASVKRTDPCYQLPEVAKLKAMASILRNQKFVTSHTPTDLLLRCNETSIDFTLGQETRENKVKTSNFTAETDDKTSVADVYGMGGGVSWRYGFQLKKEARKRKASLKSDGVSQPPESGTVDSNSLRLESAMRFSNMSVGAFLVYTSETSKKSFTVAGREVTTTADQIGLLQPGLAFNLKVKDTEILLGRVQGAEETKKSETLRLPWTNYLRVISLLEQDQGFRLQLERSGALGTDSTQFNKGLIAYFLSVDNATVDIAWFARSASYESNADATGDQLAAFGFVASLVWQFADYAELYASIHSVNANDTLGGSDNRSAHENIFGAQLGSQYVF